MPTVLLGEKVKLEATFGEAPMTGVRWTVAGRTVAGYTQSKQKGEVKPITEEQLTQTPLTLHWIETGVFQVTATGNEGSSTVEYTVVGPTEISMTSVTHTVGVRPVDTIIGKRPHLVFGDESQRRPGIRWTCKVTGPALRGGEIACTQLMRMNRVRTLADQTREGLVSDGFVLDEVIHYNVWIPTEEDIDEEDVDEVFTVKVPKNTEATLISEDSPGSPLTPKTREQKGVLTYETAESFRTYLCFKSKAAESIWVTLRRMDWDWAGTATYSSQTTKWTASACANAVNPAGQIDGTLPTWTVNKDDVERASWQVL